MASTPGTSLGPYEVLEPLGSGGMGEVYRARDPRLGREVAIKLLSSSGTPSPDQLRRFETEARAVAALSHPNVITLFDVGTHEGVPYLVLELLEGHTLREVLQRQAPTLHQAVSWALEIAHGLAAAHARGIVHRDLKPENVVLTTEGRIKVLDFGLARLREGASPLHPGDTATETRPGHVLGTAGYMAPEQVRGEVADARSDVFSLGAVLYEMVTRRCPFPRKSDADALAAILRDDPPSPSSLNAEVPPGLEALTRRCLAKDRTRRFTSAAEVAAALETVLASLRSEPRRVTPPAEPHGPYPGLASFTEEDAERFFGREAEVEALWTKLRRERLLALIGPSGAGKTSFVRAGLVPSRPTGWGAIVTTPGRAPLRSLGQALVEELPSDADTMRQLLGFEDESVAFSVVHRWRENLPGAVLVVDQFEELFTLNPPEVQARFAALLGRLTGEGDVRVLLSMRDDFLVRCHEHEPLEAVFRNLTPILELRGDDLRRALTEPATREGFTFEDEALVAQMLESVEGARGALPLLAFALARLWEKRDRERKLLTRQAYDEIGGVAGALARHAEQSLHRIGLEREPIAREIFRNLVTAHGTRVAPKREEILSVLPDREAGAQVLDELIDARLLTSYEVRSPAVLGLEPSVSGVRETTRGRRVEVVHESLFRAWPRFVRWRAQDEEGAVLRDQLKQAAHLWDEKGRSPDLLWSGAAFREFELWRKRYPGTLTAGEDAFTRSMIRRERRRTRVRRWAAATLVVGLAAVAAVIAVSRHREAEARRRAEAAARRAEASKLVALGRLDMETHPTAALAYARRSLEMADTPEARRFALEILWRGPVARILPVAQVASELHQPGGIVGDLTISRDGRWLATRTHNNRQILLFPRDGGPPRALPHPPEGNAGVLQFGPRNQMMITGGSGERLRFWSLPDLQEVGHVELGGVQSLGRVLGGKLLTLTRMSWEDEDLVKRAWSLPDGDRERLGKLEGWPWAGDPTGTWLAFARGRSVSVRRLDGSGRRPERILGRSREDVQQLAFAPTGDRLASIDKSDEIRLWSPEPGTSGPSRVLQGPAGSGHPLGPFVFSGDGSTLAAGQIDGSLHVWDLEGPPDARPAILRRPDEIDLFPATSDPAGPWLVAGDGRSVAFWPLSTRRMRALRGSPVNGYWLPFSADSRWLVSCGVDDATRRWALRPDDGGVRPLTQGCYSAAAHPTRPEVIVGRNDVLLVPIDGGPPRRLLEVWEGANQVYPVAFDVQGRRAVAGPIIFKGAEDPKQRFLRIWDLDSGAQQVISVADITDSSWRGFSAIAFAADGTLFVSGNGGVHHLVLPGEPGGTVSIETVYARAWAGLDLSRDGRHLLVWTDADGEGGSEDLLLLDLEEHTSRRITTHGGHVRWGALDPSGRIIVTVDVDGVGRAGPATGEEPHLLLGQTGAPTAVSVSPDGRWVASWSGKTIHLWPMPDVAQPPFHTLPHDVLVARLESFTNLRAVRDPASSTGWTTEIGPFPGWTDVPIW